MEDNLRQCFAQCFSLLLREFLAFLVGTTCGSFSRPMVFLSSLFFVCVYYLKLALFTILLPPATSLACEKEPFFLASGVIGLT